MLLITAVLAVTLSGPLSSDVSQDLPPAAAPPGAAAASANPGVSSPGSKDQSAAPKDQDGEQYNQILRNVPLYRKAIDSGMPFPKTRRIVFQENKPASLPGWVFLELL